MLKNEEILEEFKKSLTATTKSISQNKLVEINFTKENSSIEGNLINLPEPNIESLKKNSNFDHQILVHVNQGTDGTLEYLKSINIEHTYTIENIGMPKALNLASKKAKFKYILISHDDFYYCPGWDVEFVNELKKINHKKIPLMIALLNAITKNKKLKIKY